MTTLVWVCLLAAAALAVWVIARFPGRRPRTVGKAILLFLAAQLVPNLGLLVLPGILRAHGPQFALVAVVLPAFSVLWLTSGWLVLAVSDAFGSRLTQRPVE